MTLDVCDLIRIAMRLCFDGVEVSARGDSHVDDDVWSTAAMGLCKVVDDGGDDFPDG